MNSPHPSQSDPLEHHPTIFHQHLSDSVAADARVVQAAAHKLQQACGDRGRVHVIYEALAPGPADSTKPAELAFINIIYSPTISLDGPAGIRAAAQLTTALRSIADSLKSMPPSLSLAMQHSLQAVQTEGIPRPEVSREQLTLEWYPGDKFSPKNPEWLREKLQVAEDVYNKFSHLERRETETIYQKLFGRMYRVLKPRLPSEKGPLRYWRFTPPWLRKTIAIGDFNIILDSESMPELRSQRNRMGERRLKAVLAAFFEREDLARGILEDLLNKQPSASPIPICALNVSELVSGPHEMDVVPIHVHSEEQCATIRKCDANVSDALERQNAPKTPETPTVRETSFEPHGEDVSEVQTKHEAMDSGELSSEQTLNKTRYNTESDEAQKPRELQETQRLGETCDEYRRHCDPGSQLC